MAGRWELQEPCAAGASIAQTAAALQRLCAARHSHVFRLYLRPADGTALLNVAHAGSGSAADGGGAGALAGPDATNGAMAAAAASVGAAVAVSDASGSAAEQSSAPACTAVHVVSCCDAAAAVEGSAVGAGGRAGADASVSRGVVVGSAVSAPAAVPAVCEASCSGAFVNPSRSRSPASPALSHHSLAAGSGSAGCTDLVCGAGGGHEALPSQRDATHTDSLRPRHPWRSSAAAWLVRAATRGARLETLSSSSVRRLRVQLRVLYKSANGLGGAIDWAMRLRAELARVALLTQLSHYVSTMGGAHSQLGEASRAHARRAKVRARQLGGVAMALGDASLAWRCLAFVAQSHVQLGTCGTERHRSDRKRSQMQNCIEEGNAMRDAGASLPRRHAHPFHRLPF